MVVVLPDPFGPRYPKTSPRSIENVTSSTPRARPYHFVRDSISIAAIANLNRPCSFRHPAHLPARLRRTVLWSRFRPKAR